MKSRLYSLILSGAFVLAVPAFAQSAQQPAGQASARSGKLVPVTEKDAAWAAKARKDYPLDVCLTSDEKLGSMGKSPEYIYRVDGQPDRLVVFCCDGCEEDFMKEPAKYLAKIDAAKSKGKAGAAPKANDSKDAHKGHH
jgi:hypothetical protein